MVLTTDPALAGAVRKTQKDNSTQHGPWREAGTPGQGTNHIQEGEWVSGVPREMTTLRRVGDAQPGVFNLEQPVWSVRGVRGWEAWNEPQNLGSTGAVGRARAGMGRDTHTMNSERLHHFQTSTFIIFSAKVLPQRGSMANIRFSLQPPTGGDSPREERVVSITRKARCCHDP